MGNGSNRRNWGIAGIWNFLSRLTTNHQPLTTPSMKIRFILKSDLPAVMAIERSSFEHPWSEAEFRATLQARNCLGLVADWDNQVVGYVVYELFTHRIQLLNLAVSPDYRRGRHGRQLVATLQGRIHPDRRALLACEVRETNLSAQKFFRACGFRAVEVLRNYYRDVPEEAAYVFQWRVPEEGGVRNAECGIGRNRIASYEF